MILPSDFEYTYYTDEAGNIYSEQEYGTMLTDVLGNLIQIPAEQIVGGVQIATGSYTGTGTYGASDPNTLTFEFEPKFLMVTSGGYYHLISIYGDTTTYLDDPSSSAHYNDTISWEGKTVSWYNSGKSSTAPEAQLNISGKTYYYFAIG